MRRGKEVVVGKRAWGTAALLTLVASLLLAGCVGVGPVHTDSERVDLGGAESVRVEIDLGVGALLMDGGAADLLEAQFTYSEESWKPELEYTVGGTEGRLSIRQPSEAKTMGWTNVHYEWDLRFNSDVPMDMKIDLGVGGGDLDLGDLNLRELDIDVGVGGAEIDLTGERERDLQATIHGGVGGLKVLLPRDVGVRVEAESGLGRVDGSGFNREGDVYTNDAYGRTDVTLSVRLDVGVGGVGLELAD
jgi:hypothetical protein